MVRVEILHNDTWAKTYLIIDEATQSAALVDPVFGRHEADLQHIEEMGLTLQFAIATHTHADHVTACFELRDTTGCEYVMWKDTASLNVSLYVDDEQSIMLGETELTFHFAPGHTSDSILVEAPGYVMTGDFLFTGTGGVGRDDLPSGRLRAHFDALSILARFGDEVMVFSGHDPPGTEMRSMGWNRAHNPVLQMTSFGAYREWQMGEWERLGPVTKIKTAIPANIFSEQPPEMD